MVSLHASRRSPEMVRTGHRRQKKEDGGLRARQRGMAARCTKRPLSKDKKRTLNAREGGARVCVCSALWLHNEGSLLGKGAKEGLGGVVLYVSAWRGFQTRAGQRRIYTVDKQTKTMSLGLEASSSIIGEGSAATIETTSRGPAKGVPRATLRRARAAH